MGVKVNAYLIMQYLKDNNLTKLAFCKQCKISIIEFYKIIKGRNFNLSSLFRVAKKIDIPIHKFFS